MGPKKKLCEQQPAVSVITYRQVVWCADVISVVAEFLPPTDQYQKPLMLVSKLWLEGVAQQHGMKVLGNDVHWPFAALRHRGSQKLIWSSTSPVSTMELDDLVQNLSSCQISSLTLFDVSPEVDLRCLNTMENLTALQFRTFAAHLPDGLGVLTTLKTLDAHSSGHVADCKTISGLSHLECLRLHSSAALMVESLNHLTKLKVLTSLSLHGDDGCGDEHMKVIGQMTQLTKLEIWVVKEFTDAGMKSLSQLVNLNRLKLWDVNSITGKGLRLLGKLKKLTFFSLYFNHRNTISNEDFVFFHELQELLSFKISLCGCYTLSDEWLQHICGARSLRSLDLSLFRITIVGLKHLERLHQLETLHLPKLPFPTEAALVSLALLPQLEHLKVSSRVTVTEFCTVTTFKKLKTLRVRLNEDAGSSSGLDGLDDNVSCLVDLHVSNANDFVLHRISWIRTLTVLCLEASVAITDDGVQHLSSLVNLETLTLNNLTITGSGFSGFGTKLRKLTTLKLQWCDNLEDHGMHHVGEISSLKSLEVK